MTDTAAQIYSDLHNLSDRLTQLQHDHALTLDHNPDRTRDAVHQALTLLDQAGEQISKLETLQL